MTKDEITRLARMVVAADNGECTKEEFDRAFDPLSLSDRLAVLTAYQRMTGQPEPLFFVNPDAATEGG
jgi:hypothetical protein